MFHQSILRSSSSYIVKSLLAMVILLSLTNSLTVNDTLVDKMYVKTCRGWCLKKYPVFKEFLEQDFDHYDSSVIEVDYLGGGFPRVVLVDENNNNIKTYDVSKLSREKIRAVFKALKVKLIKPLRPLNDIDDSKVKIIYWNLIFRKLIVQEKQKLKLLLKKHKKNKKKLCLKNYKGFLKKLKKINIMKDNRLIISIILILSHLFLSISKKS